jgi:hypothetical protein
MSDAGYWMLDTGCRGLGTEKRLKWTREAYNARAGF